MRKKKFLKIIAFSLLFVVLLVVWIPVLFEDKIIQMVKQSVNENVNATLDFKDADLSLWRNFPKAAVSMQDAHLINHAPFEGDTLFSAKNIAVSVPLFSVFKASSSGIQISSFEVDGAHINILVDEKGNANYDIAKSEEEETNTTTTDETGDGSSVKLGIQSYKIENSSIRYTDLSSKMALQLKDFNHRGKGDFSADRSTLETFTETILAFEKEGNTYINNQKLELKADLDMDLKQNKYSFLENELKINQLPLHFDGFVQLFDTHQEVDMKLKTPTSDFKNLLALIPEAYATSLDGVQTAGSFDVNGHLKGKIDEEHIPQFDIHLQSKNASFKYPDLPKSLEHIDIDLLVKNETGLTKDTQIDLNNFAFQIDQERFKANAKLRELLGAVKVNAGLKGVVNLANLEQIYPADALKGLKGILNMDATTKFDMEAVEKQQYERTQTTGQLGLANFEYQHSSLKHPLQIQQSQVNFQPNRVSLQKFDAVLGETDMSARGTVDNLLGFVFNDEKIEGNFQVRANKFVVADFMTSEEENSNNKESTNDNSSNTGEESIKIPAFLDCNIQANANTVVYDNMTLSNLSGALQVKDEAANLNQMRAKVFGGDLGFSGKVSTKEETPTFDMKLDMSKFNIGESFQVMDLLKMLAPITNSIQGKLNSNIRLSGNLKEDLTPDLGSLTGDVLAQLLSTNINAEKSPLLQSLDSNLKFIDLKKLNLNDIKTFIQLENGKVKFKPFDVQYEDVTITVAGAHGLDQSMDYNATFQVPAKYLGKELGNAVAQLSDADLKDVKVPVTANIGGSFLKPKVKTDLASATKNLTQQIVAKQKEKLLGKGTDAVTDALGGLLGGKDKKKDSTKTNTDTNKKVEDAAKNILGGLFGGNKKKKDSTKQ
ncbi:MAG: AsmA family protein [Flavobacteriaceae bacterium]|nr:AsmA family protein [Flavobacteriaceae bacterium]